MLSEIGCCILEVSSIWLKKDAFNSSNKILKDVLIFDVFSSKEMKNKKSYALGFVFQDFSKTLKFSYSKRLMRPDMHYLNPNLIKGFLTQK